MEPHAPSYYAATANPHSRHPALEGQAEADVVVVGGGFTGLAAALAAAEAGYTVVLLEARRIGWGASGRNGGQMIPGLRWSAGDLARQFGDAHARDLLRLALEANARVRARIEQHAIACDLRDGHFQAAWKPAHYDAMQRECETLARLVNYRGLRPVPRAEVGGIVATDRYHGGLFDANGGHLHPLNYALGLAAAAARAGVRVFEDTPAVGIRHAPVVSVETPRGEVRARFGVLACDAEIGSVEPRLGLAMMPVVNYNVATRPLGEDRALALIPSRAAIAESRFVLNYYRISADHRLIFGGGEKYTPAPPLSIEGFVRPHIAEVFPQLRGIEIEHAWGGTVGITLNRLPAFGRIGNSFYAHGYSGQGVLLATLAGELAVEALRGTAERFDLFAGLPRRDFPGGRWLRHPLHVAGMLWYALKDRI